MYSCLIGEHDKKSDVTGGSCTDEILSQKNNKLTPKHFGLYVYKRSICCFSVIHSNVAYFDHLG